MRDECGSSAHVLGVSLLSYMVICFVGVHLVAFLMVDAVAEFGLSIAKYSLAQGAGNGMKCVLLLFTGPLMERFGAPKVANATLAACAALLVVLASASTSTSFTVAMVALISITALAEQPTFVVILAGYFQAMQSIATTSITASFSASGAILPLVLAPVLVSAGWRAVCWDMLGVCAVVLPLALLVVKPGPIAVGRQASEARAVARDASNAEDGGSASTGAPDASDGETLEQAARSWTFWALVGANYLFMVFCAIIVNHLPMVLRTDANLTIHEAAGVMSLQYSAGMGAKLAVGVLVGLPSPPRLFLFVGAPLAYTAAHLLLFDVRVDALLARDFSSAIVVARSLRRLQLFGLVVGLAFGFIFGLIQCLPIRLFGRRDLPTIQSLMYAVVMFANATVIPIMGLLRDAFGETYSVPLLVSFVATAALQLLFYFLMAKDVAATEVDRVALV